MPSLDRLRDALTLTHSVDPRLDSAHEEILDAFTSSEPSVGGNLCSAQRSPLRRLKPITVALVFDGLTREEREPLRGYLIAVPDLYSETVARLADGSYDFACLGALTYIQSHVQYGVIPLVRRSSDLQYHSVSITGAGSSIYSLRDLKGKRFALGDINAASTRLIAYRELIQAGVNPKTDLTLRYSGSHVATAALVESGVVDAGF